MSKGKASTKVTSIMFQVILLLAWPLSTVAADDSLSIEEALLMFSPWYIGQTDYISSVPEDFPVIILPEGFSFLGGITNRNGIHLTYIGEMGKPVTENFMFQSFETQGWTIPAMRGQLLRVVSG
jgi:hypothetical protein